jgi:hypothetical protein
MSDQSVSVVDTISAFFGHHPYQTNTGIQWYDLPSIAVRALMDLMGLHLRK